MARKWIDRFQTFEADVWRKTKKGDWRTSWPWARSAYEQGSFIDLFLDDKDEQGIYTPEFRGLLQRYPSCVLQGDNDNNPCRLSPYSIVTHFMGTRKQKIAAFMEYVEEEEKGQA